MMRHGEETEPGSGEQNLSPQAPSPYVPRLYVTRTAFGRVPDRYAELPCSTAGFPAFKMS